MEKEPKYETIESIKEFEGNGWEGYKIKTNKQVIEIKIDSQRDCCEDWGHICSDEDLDRYKDAHLYSISIVDNDSRKDILVGLDIDDLESGNACFVNLDTNLGIVQFALYNQHNGFYGHPVKIVSKQLKFDYIL